MTPIEPANGCEREAMTSDRNINVFVEHERDGCWIDLPAGIAPALRPIIEAMMPLDLQARTLVLKLKDRRWLALDAHPDTWCTAISSVGYAPRDHLHQLDEIRHAVGVLRGHW
jgi:hypothetical protein